MGQKEKQRKSNDYHNGDAKALYPGEGSFFGGLLSDATRYGSMNDEIGKRRFRLRVTSAADRQGILRLFERDGGVRTMAIRAKGRIGVAQIYAQLTVDIVQITGDMFHVTFPASMDILLADGYAGQLGSNIVGRMAIATGGSLFGL